MIKIQPLFSIVVGSIFVSGCSSLAPKGVEASVLVIKVPHGFEVSLHNPSSKALCMTPGLWPNGAGGYVGYVEGAPMLMHQGDSYDYKLRLSALGHGREPLKLRSGETLKHTFKYSDFEDAPADSNFSFAPTLWPCSNWN